MAATPPPPTFQRAALPAGLFADLHEVRQWAAAHGLAHLLGVSLSAISVRARIDPPQQMRMWRTPFESLLIRPTSSSIDKALLRHALAVAADVIDDEAAQLSIAQGEEQKARATELPQARALWANLVELRAAVRMHAAPRPAALRQAHPARLDDRTGELCWTEPARWAGRGQGFFVEARLRRGGDRLIGHCTCGAVGSECAHVLTLIDCALDALCAKPPTALADALVRALGRPSWQLALDALAPPARQVDVAAAKPKRVAAAFELWWRADSFQGIWLLTAELRRTTRSGPQMTRMPATELLKKYRLALAEVDLAIAEAAARAAKGGELYAPAAFAAAVGHPRILCDDVGEGTIALVRVALGVRVAPHGRALRVEPAIEGEAYDARLLREHLAAHPAEVPIVAPDPRRSRLLLIDASRAARRVLDAIERYGDSFPEEAQPMLLERLGGLRDEVAVTIAESTLGHAVAAQPTLLLRLRLPPEGALEIEACVRPGPGAPCYAPGEGPRDVLLARSGERGYVRRTLEAESEWARARLATLPEELRRAEEGPPWCFTAASLDDALALIAALESPRDGVEIEWLGERPVVSGRVTAKELRVSVFGDRDWFGIKGAAKVETGRLELAVLLDAARRQRRFVQVGPGRFVALADELRARLAALAERTFVQPRGLGLSASAAPALTELAELGATVDEAPPWAALRERAQAAGDLTPAPPPGLVAELRPYQLDGYRWLARLAAWGAGGCLADDMGLGKTVQAIALLLARSELGPQLVLAPTSVCWSWAAEIARFAPKLRVVELRELAAGDARRAALADAGAGDIVIASYGLLLRERSALAEQRFGTIVFDEAQALKNAETLRTRAARSLVGEMRVALTGTPLENHLGELWSLYSVVFPGLLGTWSQFRDTFAGPIERMADPRARAALGHLLRPFLLRRTKPEVARELPARVEITMSIELSDEEQALYEDARLAAVAELTPQGKDVRDAQRRFVVLAALTRLRLVACHPRLADPTSRVPSSKLARALELLEELRACGHRALVFSQFTSHLALVRQALAERGFHTLYLDGASPAARRQELVTSFQEGEGEVFLISLGAGGTGLTLTGADYVLHLDPWWNPAVEDQATDRAHRIGQTRPVTVVRLVARGTIEEKILALHAHKRALVADILDGKGAAARLSTEELAELLAASAQVLGERDEPGDEPGDETDLGAQGP